MTISFPSDIGDFVIGFSPIGEFPIPQPAAVSLFPPLSNTSVQNITPSYLYVQYNDDPHLQALVDAYNAYAQGYYNYLNNLGLPIYTNPNTTGLFLNFVALGIYGFLRPALSAQGRAPIGPFNTSQFNTLEFNGWRPGLTPAVFATGDDVFKRIITWHIYKGDGFVFNIRWLKRRLKRFLYGVNGTDPTVLTGETYDVSVVLTAPSAATITLPASRRASLIFQEAVASGAIELPFQINWTITLV